MQVVNVQLAEAVDLDRSVEVGEFIELCFFAPPVVATLPSFGETLDITQRCAIVPGRIVKLKR